MVGIFVMVIVTLALIAGASASAYYTLTATQTVLSAQQNQARLHSLGNIVRNSIISLDRHPGIPVQPVSSTDPDFLARVPVQFAFTRTSAGQDILYCPVIAQGPTDDVTSTELVNHLDGSATEKYDVGIRIYGGISYLVSGYPGFTPSSDTVWSGKSAMQIATSLNEIGIYGFVVAPDPKAKGALRCGDVDMQDGGIFTIAGGSVVPVYGSLNDEIPANYVVSSDGGAIVDRGERLVSSLDDALNLIDANNQTLASIAFDASQPNVEVSSSLLREVSRGRNVTIGGETSVALSFSNEGLSDGTFLAEGNLTFNNVVLSTESANNLEMAALPGATVILNNVVFGGARVSGGVIDIRGTSQIGSSDGYALIADSGVIRINVSNTSATPFISATGPCVVSETWLLNLPRQTKRHYKD